MPHVSLRESHGVSIAELPFSIVRGLFGAIAFLLGLAAILVGLATVLHVPHLIAGGFPAGLAPLAEDLTFQFGHSNWAPILEKAGFAIFTILLVLSTTITIFIRRHDGAIHVLRAIAGNSGLWFVFLLLLHSLPILDAGLLKEIVDKGQPIGPIIEQILNPTEPMVLAVSLVVFLISMAILAWPPKKKMVAAFPQAYVV
jgi:hypothetical protein